jgi:hypothetical protein
MSFVSWRSRTFNSNAVATAGQERFGRPQLEFPRRDMFGELNIILSHERLSRNGRSPC